MNKFKVIKDKDSYAIYKCWLWQIIDEINFWEFREDNTYNELLKDPFYEFHEKRIREDIEREGDLDKLYEGIE